METFHDKVIFLIQIEGNTKLEASVEKRKKTLQGRQLCLEKEVRL